MKYTRLTKEQFEALQEEFTRFLATQSITADEWATLKAEKPEVAEAELDVFSDLVWEGALKAANFLENSSTDQLFSFAVKEDHLALIHVKVEQEGVDLRTSAGKKWMLENLAGDSVEIQQGKKGYSEDRSLDIFALIRQGAEIVNNEFHKALWNAVDN